MVTNTTKVICPNCRKGNCYELQKLELFDTDLHVSYCCETCGTEYTDVYALACLIYFSVTGKFLDKTVFDGKDIYFGR